MQALNKEMSFPDGPDVEGNRKRHRMIEWHKKHPYRVQLAIKGDPVAQYELGQHLLGNYKSYDPTSGNQIAVIVNNQIEFPKATADEMAQGVAWLHKSADQGFVEALFALGNCYSAGEGVAKDQIEAYAYYNIISEVDDYGRYNRDNLAKYKPEIVACGEQRTRELLKEYDAKWPAE